MARVLIKQTNMAAKNFFACFCRLLKRAPQTTKWKKESLKLRSTVLTFEKNVLQSACTTTMHQKSSESSRNDSVTKCCQEESRNNYFLFSLPLTILLSMLLSRRTANCGKNDENSEQTPQKKYPFYFSRTVKAAKRKTMTEAARAGLCKRRLFPPTENKENNNTSVEARILRKNSHDPKNASGEMVSANCGNW